MADYNLRFAVMPRNSSDAHRAVLRGSAAGRGREELAAVHGPREGGATVPTGSEAAAGPSLASCVQPGGDRGGRRLRWPAENSLMTAGGLWATHPDGPCSSRVPASLRPFESRPMH